MCDFQVQRWMQTVLLEVHKNIATTLCIRIASDSKMVLQSTVFFSSGTTSCLEILSSHSLREIRLPRIFLAKTHAR